MKMLKNMWKITDTNVDVTESKVYKCLESAENGNFKEFKKLYKELCKSSFGANYLQKGFYRLQGYEFSFISFLRRFLVKFRNDNVYQVIYAINKTNIFDNFYITKYNVDDIIEDTRKETITKKDMIKG